MNNVYIGKLITTHGIKGEVRISSDFEYKDHVFVVGKKLIINNREFTINSYRVHKGYDMVTFVEVNDINDVIPLKQAKVYIRREDLNLENYFIYDDLLGMEVVLNDISIGTINDYITGLNKLIQVKGVKTFFIHFVNDYIIKIDKENNRVYVSDMVKDLMK